MSNTNNRISKLEREVERLKKYVTIRDGVWIEEYIDSLDKYIIDYRKIGDEETIMRLELDNLIMCHARSKKDFMEYCRRAVLQMESFMEWGLRNKMDNPRKVKKYWKKAQKNKVNRIGERARSDFPSNIGRAGFSDCLETSFLIFYDSNFYEIDFVKDQFFCLLKTNSIRNIASHGSEDGNWESRMTSAQKKFYKNRDTKYKEIIDNMKKIKTKVVEHFE